MLKGSRQISSCLQGEICGRNPSNRYFPATLFTAASADPGLAALMLLRASVFKTQSVEGKRPRGQSFRTGCPDAPPPPLTQVSAGGGGGRSSPTRWFTWISEPVQRLPSRHSAQHPCAETGVMKLQRPPRGGGKLPEQRAAPDAQPRLSPIFQPNHLNATPKGVF